ncbi:histone deacetylase [Corynebacterium casei]|uniref:histone deacetylase n=1 Tax=Corynebacterium casei TaxID=160386 RepID=UPI003FD5702C
MALKKALAAVAVSATAAAVLVNTAVAQEKTISVAQGDLVGNCYVSFNDPSTNRSYFPDHCADLNNPTRLYGKDNAPVDGKGQFIVSGQSDLGTKLSYIQWNDDVEVKANTISATGFDAAPAVGTTVYFNQPAYGNDRPAQSGQGTYAGEINGTHFIDFGDTTGFVNGTPVWTDNGILGIIDGAYQSGSHPTLSLVASTEATGGATGEATKKQRTELFDAYFSGETTPSTSEEPTTEPSTEPSTESSVPSTTPEEPSEEPKPSEAPKPSTPSEPSPDLSSLSSFSSSDLNIPGLDLKLPF